MDNDLQQLINTLVEAGYDPATAKSLAGDRARDFGSAHDATLYSRYWIERGRLSAGDLLAHEELIQRIVAQANGDYLETAIRGFFKDGLIPTAQASA